MIYISVFNGIEVEYILYTGDISCNRDIPFTKIPYIDELPINHLITESTYGGQQIPQKSEEEIVKELYGIIYGTCIMDEGVAIIPSFAMARSTNVAYYIKKAYNKYLSIRDIQIYMVSPLMKKCHDTIGSNMRYYDDKWELEKKLFKWNKIKYITHYKDVIALGNSKEPCVIISSSGMDIKGCNSFIIPKKAESNKNSITFVGYCAENTVGYQLINGLITEMQYNIDGEITKIDEVNINVNNISGMSSHACGYEIINMIKTANTNKLKNIVIVHGDLKRGESFKEDLSKAFNKAKIFIPKIDESIKFI